MMVVPLFVTSAFAVGGTNEEIELKRAIISLGSDPLQLNVVAPAHLPVPSGSNGIGPGSQLIIDRPDGSFLCTANFIWENTSTETTTTTKGNGKGFDKSGGKGKGGQQESTVTTTKTTYLGSAGHCFLPVDTSATHGSDADYDPARSTVYACYADCDFGGQLGAFLEGIHGTFVRLGAVKYARQDRGGEALGQDFGLVEIPSELSDHVRPTMPVWGGPSSVEEVSLGSGVCVYGNAAGFGETFPTKARAGAGLGLGPDEKHWEAAIPSFQGDSGSGIVTCGPDADGLHGLGAAGVLTHIGLARDTARMLGTTMGQATEMARLDAGLSIKVVLEGSTESPAPPSWPANDPNGTLSAIGEQYSWGAGPFTRVSTIDQFDGCSGVEGQDECDYEYVQVNVPEGGATLKVTISTQFSEDDDFDLYMWGPDGQPLGSSTSGGTPPEVLAVPISASGVYTIGVNPWLTLEANYSGVATLEDPPAPPDPGTDPDPTPTSPLASNPRIYQAGLIDPFVLDGHILVPGTSVTLSARSLRSTDPAVTLELGSFEAVHKITRDGEPVYGPFEAEEAADGLNFQSNSDWVVPEDAPFGSYVFEVWVTVGGQTYLAGSLPFSIGV